MLVTECLGDCLRIQNCYSSLIICHTAKNVWFDRVHFMDRIVCKVLAHLGFIQMGMFFMSVNKIAYNLPYLARTTRNVNLLTTSYFIKFFCLFFRRKLCPMFQVMLIICKITRFHVCFSTKVDSSFLRFALTRHDCHLK